MAEFEYLISEVPVRGVCATDAADDVIQASILADLPNARAGQERRLDEAQIVYTVLPVESESLDLTDAQRAVLPKLDQRPDDDPAEHVAVTAGDETQG